MSLPRQFLWPRASIYRSIAQSSRASHLHLQPCRLSSRALTSPHSGRSFFNSSYLRLPHNELPLSIFPPPPPPKKTLFRRTITFFGIAIIFTASGFILASYPGFKAANEILNPPSDAETLTMYKPTDPKAIAIDTYINMHPIAVALRLNPEIRESRPHLKIPLSQRGHNLTGGTLQGPGRVEVPAFVWAEDGGKSLVSISYLGEDLCGHPGIVHGGLLATILDEGLARCAFGALPNKVAMTANLKVDYRAPTMAGSVVVLRAWTTKVEGRKAWVKGRLELLTEGPLDGPAKGEGKVLCEAEGLFIEPKQAKTMARIYPVN